MAPLNSKSDKHAMPPLKSSDSPTSSTGKGSPSGEDLGMRKSRSFSGGSRSTFTSTASTTLNLPETGSPRGRSRTSLAQRLNGFHSVASLRGTSFRSQSRPQLRYKSMQELSFLQELEKHHVCVACEKVLRYPVKLMECSHHCCSACLPGLIRLGNRCPIDHVKLDRNKCVVDKLLQKEVEVLGVRCSYHASGCTWTGIQRDVRYHHENGCCHAVVFCPNNCDAEFEKRFLDQHLLEDCPLRDVKCPHCDVTLTLADLDDHEQICDAAPISCPNDCGQGQVPRRQMQEHLDGDCPNQSIFCPFRDAGCAEEITRKDLRAHIRQSPANHLQLLGEILQTYKSTIDVHEQAIEKQSDRLVNVETKVETMEKMYGSLMVWRISSVEQKLADAKAGKNTTIYGPPFLTGRHGYRLMLSACLNGEGKGRGRYLSAFVTICKGDNDALLDWPFSHAVTLTVIDQCQDPSARTNISHVLQPNTCKENMAFLGRPKAPRNASFGAQKFMELERLATRDYIRDDQMFIKVHVEADNMKML